MQAKNFGQPFESCWNSAKSLVSSNLINQAILAGTPVTFFRNLNPEQREATTTAVLSGCSTEISLKTTDPKPPTIPLYIPLNLNLTDPAELACAEAVAEHLSSESGRVVGGDELAGLVLYLWSEDDPDGRALTEYLGDNRRPLQGLLLEARNLEGQVDRIANAELLPFVGRRFEIFAGS
jgi:hypothetical protein